MILRPVPGRGGDPVRWRLAAESVGKRFGRREVLKAASVWAADGKITTLMGRNGSGKTTLMRIAVGALRADYGTVHWNERVTGRPSLARMARDGLMFVPERGLLAGAYTFRQNLEAVRLAFGSEMEVEEAAERMGVAEHLGKSPLDMSGGERRRGSLAAAMLRAPRCLVVDEPYVGVEPKAQGLVTEALRSVTDAGGAVVASGHDIRALLDNSDEIVWVVAGTTHVLGPPEAATKNDQFVREYLGPRRWFSSDPGTSESGPA